MNTGDGNWWTGKLKRNKTVGLFPCNYVEFIVDQKAHKSTQGTAVKTLCAKGEDYESEIGELGISENAESYYDDSQYDTQYQATIRKPTSEILKDISAALNDSQSSSTNTKPSFNDYNSDIDDYNESKSSLQHHSNLSYNSNQEDTDITPRTSLDTQQPDYHQLSYDQASIHTMPNTPPIPPPHSVSVSKISRNSSSNECHTLNLDRTPSPLRNAMEDVLDSLETLDGMSRSNSAAIKDQLVSKVSNLTLTDSNADDMMPFGPDSYNSSPDRNSPQRNGRDDQMSRADTFTSVSSLHTSSLSIGSISTTPTTAPSNMSIMSSGSLARRKYHSQSFTTEYDIAKQPVSANTYSFVSETPVELPNSKYDSRSVKSLKLHKSTGFLKKLFSSSSNSSPTMSPYQQGIENKSTDQESVEGKREDSSDGLRRTKSRSSMISSVTSPSRIRNRFRSVSSKMTVPFTKSEDKSNSYNRRSNFEDRFGRDSLTWAEIRRDVHRANTLTDNEKKQRKRALELQGIAVTDPLFSLSHIQGNETANGSAATGAGKVDLKHQDFSAVDTAIESLRSWPHLMTPYLFASSRINRHFHYDVEQLRAVFMFCASKFGWESPLISGQDEEEKDANLSRIMHIRRASPYELALCVKSMCDSLDIPCELIRGHLKSPGQTWDHPGPGPVNHFWNGVIINGEWRFIDASLANPTFPNREMYYKAESGKACTFYFLTKPNQLIYTHVPFEMKHQHLVPPLDHGAALALPVAGPHAFENHLKLVDFNTGLTRLENFEVAELKIEVPHGVELMAEVFPGSISTHHEYADEKRIPGLAQPFWSCGKRYYRIKAFLPDLYSQGRLCIYATARGLSQSIKDDVLPVAYTLGITHQGENGPFEFVTRHPTPHCKRQDLYVMQPQCKKLVGGNSYDFIIDQHPSGGLTAGAALARLKIGIQTPSGRIYKLHRKEDQVQTHGFWISSIKCLEVGNWRGLVLADRGNAWSVFCEWYCV